MSLDRGWGKTVIVAAGPSLTAEQVEIVNAAQRDGRCRVAVVNSMYPRFPRADLLYGADAPWWNQHLPAVRLQFSGELWTQDRGLWGREPWGNAARRLGLNVIRSEPGTGIHADPETVYQHGNSGAQALCLVRLFGSRDIILLAFDMQRGPNGESHSHGDHVGLSNGNPRTWIKHFDALSPQLAAEGTRVRNATISTALTCFELVDLAEALR